MLLYTLTHCLSVRLLANRRSCHELFFSCQTNSHKLVFDSSQFTCLLGLLSNSQACRSTLLGLRVAFLGGNQVVGLAIVTIGSLVFVLGGHLQLRDAVVGASLLRGVAKVDMLHLWQVELLGSKD